MKVPTPAYLFLFSECSFKELQSLIIYISVNSKVSRHIHPELWKLVPIPSNGKSSSNLARNGQASAPRPSPKQ
ncbi:CMF_collapsed_G0013280.mRNA.1.CDS.1 [Saccharomyces cerevisiae]|nr:CMF_collapsed_G0013280.mRNA.1.CDS.1 [Saccharomyces cerevisiae]